MPDQSNLHANSQVTTAAAPSEEGNSTNKRIQEEPSSQEQGTVVQPRNAELRAAVESQTGLRVTVAVPGYDILSELGRGAMGVVYKARHSKLNRLVALKMVLGGRVDEKDLIRFLAEAEAVATVKHANVVQVYDYGEVDGQPFMALEFCPGGSLAQQLSTSSPFSPNEAARIVRRVAAGVAAAHEEGIVHRDLKPGNVLLTEDGEPKVADFGLAKRAASELTATQAVMGTPSYMSPEQAGGKTKFVGPQADVWALGVILYECLCGTRPFSGHTTGEVLAKVLSAEVASVQTLRPDVPSDLALICRKCLEKNPADRYPSARELADDLDRFDRGEPISVRPLGAATRTVRWVRRNPVVAGLLAMVVLITLGLIGSLYEQYQEAVRRANTEREAKESAERERQQADIARQNAEKATQEAKLREEADRLRRQAEQRAALFTAQAANADALIALLNDLFRSSDSLASFFGDTVPLLAGSGSEGQAATLGPFLRNAASQFRASLTDPAVALVRAKLLASIGNGMKTLGMFTDAKEVLQEALALRRANLPDTHPDVWQSELDLGRLEAESGDFLAGIERFRKVFELQKRANADLAAILNTRLYEGITLATAGFPEAETVLRDVVKERERLNGKSHKDTLLAKLALIAWFLDRQRWAEVVTLFAEFREGIQKLPDGRVREIFEPIMDCQAKVALANAAIAPGSVLAGSLRNAIAGLRSDIGRLEKVLPDDHLLLVIFRFELAKLLLHINEGREADALLTRVLADTRKTVGVAHPRALNLLTVYSRHLVATKRINEARAFYDEVEKANRKRFGSENPWLSIILLKRAAFEQQQGANDKALTSAKDALTLLNRGKFLTTLSAIHDLFETAQILGSSSSPPLRATAQQLFSALRPLVAKVYGPKSEEMAIALVTEGKLLYDTGDRVAAAALFAQALAILPAVPKLEPIQRANVLFWSGRVAIECGQFAEAERLFRDLREAGKKVPDYSLGNREEDAICLARSLAAQGRYKDAIPFFEEAKKYAVQLKAAEKQLAWADMLIAETQLAAGQRDAYLKTLKAMFRQYGKSRDVNTLARLAWAAGLNSQPEGWEPAKFEAAYKAAYQPDTLFPWGYRGLALVRLRCGDFAGVEAALERAGKTVHPVDHLIRGLAAAARKNPAARTHLTKAEALIAAEKPSDKNPFAYAGRAWNQDTEVAILLTELRAALALPVAPPPHAKE